VGQTTPVPNDVLLAPSILAADYAVLAEEVERVRPECDWLHVDLMDGHFVPNLSIGPPVVASIRRHTDLFLDCHLMVTDPGFWLEQLAEAGADLCSVHVELGDPTPLLGRIRELGIAARAGVAEALRRDPKKVHLTLFVKVLAEWSREEAGLRRLGYTPGGESK